MPIFYYSLSVTPLSRYISKDEHCFNILILRKVPFDFHHKLDLMQSELESIINSLMSRANVVIMPLT